MAVLFKRIAELLLKHLRNELTDPEKNELQQWVAASAENQRLFEQLTTEEQFRRELKAFHDTRLSVFQKIEAGIQEQPVVSIAPKRSWKKYLAAAAVIGILASAALYFFFPGSSTAKQVTGSEMPTEQLSDVLPGGNKATLTISGGVIVLDSAVNGVIAENAGSKVMLQDGELAYSSNSADQPIAEFSTLRTENSNYRLRLEDGTQVWLNALSSITYPNVFTGNERVVEITGEAYFEVAHNAARPFIVKKANSDISVRVLGTHFNVNAYPDEKEIQITLLEGSVKASAGEQQSAILKPGQQAAIRDAQLKVINDVDLDAAVAWKNGRFQFRSADLETVLRQAARWYGIQVEYPDGAPGDTFSGPIPKSLNLEEFLHILDLSEVNVELKENRKLVVYRKR